MTTVAARDVYGLAFAGNGSAAASSVADGASESKTPQTPSGSNVTEMPRRGTLCNSSRMTLMEAFRLRLLQAVLGP